MGTFTANWEDEENNRSVSFSIDYMIENDDVAITNVTPQTISFRCPQTGDVQRTIGVRTDAGHRVVANQIERSAHFANLANQIRERELVASV